MSSKSKGKGKKTPSQDKDKEEEVDWAEMARLAISAAPNDPASRRGMAPPADPQGQSPSAARAASQAQASMAAGSSRPVASLRVWQRNLAAFWRRHGAAFTSWWRRLSPVDRKSFILATAPFTPDERGKTWVQRGGERHEVHGQVNPDV